MKLSIITVNLNNRDGLKRTIDSVVSQSFSDFEWVVIDGGSTDGSKELIEQHKEHFAYWCSEPDKGVYCAMNKGIEHAKGEWLQFLNSGDCLYEPTTLEHVFVPSHKSDIIYGNASVQINGKYTIRTYPSKLSLSYLINHPINHQASFYKRTLYINNKFDEQYTVISDYLFLLELAISGKVFEYVNITIASSQEGGLSTTKMGIDESNNHKPIIPALIQNDMDKLIQIEQHDYYIKSHKSLRVLNKMGAYILDLAEKTIRKIENNRKN